MHYTMQLNVFTVSFGQKLAESRLYGRIGPKGRYEVKTVGGKIHG
jgi:hypothetical protein